MLPKKHRLPLRTELRRVKKEGRLIHGELFSLQMGRSGEDKPSRFGFIISTKIHKKAVKRNRVKRLLSEAIVDLVPETKSGFEVIFLAKRKIIDANFEEVKKEVKKLFIEAGLIK